MKLASFALASLCLVLSACSPEPIEGFVGCFSTSSGGSADIMITQRDDESYAVALRKQQKWSDPGRLLIGDTAFVEKSFGKYADKVQASLHLAESPFAIYRVDPEEKINQATIESGYVASFYFGSGQVYKAKCS